MILELGTDVQKAIALAFTEARHRCSSVVGTPHLFIALTKLEGRETAALRAQGHDPTQVRAGSR